jgi:hypothetical protein
LKHIEIDFNTSRAFWAYVVEGEARSESDKSLSNEEKLNQNASFQELWWDKFILDPLSTWWHFLGLNSVNKQSLNDLT